MKPLFILRFVAFLSMMGATVQGANAWTISLDCGYGDPPFDTVVIAPNPTLWCELTKSNAGMPTATYFSFDGSFYSLNPPAVDSWVIGTQTAPYLIAANPDDDQTFLSCITFTGVVNVGATARTYRYYAPRPPHYVVMQAISRTGSGEVTQNATSCL